MYNVDYHEGMQLTKLPVNSVIVRPEDRSLMSAGVVEVEGYAMSDGEHEITWVTVSPDGGRSWQRAEFLNEPQLLAALADRIRVAAGAARNRRARLGQRRQFSAGDDRQRLEFQGLRQQRLASREDYVEVKSLE